LLFPPFSFSCPCWFLAMAQCCDTGKSMSQELSLICFVKMNLYLAFHLYFKHLLLFRLSILFFLFWGKVKFIVYFYIIFKLSEQILLKKKSLLYSQKKAVPPAATNPSRPRACGAAAKRRHRLGLCPYFILFFVECKKSC
jgi:hypothetical protein